MATTYSAYTVYWYDRESDPPDGYGMAGRIVDDRTVSLSVAANMNTSLNGDPKVEGFIDFAGNSRIAVTDRVENVQQPVYFHDAASGAQVTTAHTWPEENLYTLARLGEYLYAIDYDKATVVEIDASAPYAATGATYTLDPSFVPPDEYVDDHLVSFMARGQALLVVNNTLYGLFTFPDDSELAEYYAPSLLVRFAISGSGAGRISVAVSNPEIEKNAFSLAHYDGNIYIASIGGRQNAGGTGNPDSKIQSVPCPALSAPTTVLSNDSVAFPYEFRDISFKDDGTAYILAGAYDANWNLKGNLSFIADLSSPVTPGDLEPFDEFEEDYGYFWSAQYTPDNERVWYARGNEVWVYDASSDPPTIVGTLPMSTLKGAAAAPYTDLNDLAYVGPAAASVTLRGYRSHLQRSNSKFARAARALTRGRPELTPEEFARLAALHGAP